VGARAEIERPLPKRLAIHRKHRDAGVLVPAAGRIQGVVAERRIERLLLPETVPKPCRRERERRENRPSRVHVNGTMPTADYIGLEGPQRRRSPGGTVPCDQLRFGLYGLTGRMQERGCTYTTGWRAKTRTN